MAAAYAARPERFIRRSLRNSALAESLIGGCGTAEEVLDPVVDWQVADRRL